MEEPNPELESFREQWRAEVSAKLQAEQRKVPPARNIPSSSQSKGEHSGSSAGKDAGYNTGGGSRPDPESRESNGKTGSRELRSALEHYELAVEIENQGNLTESLNLYRKAFRMDDKVDQLYKNKHFPPSSFAKKPPTVSLSTIQPSSSKETSTVALATNDLIISFSKLAILPAPPEIEGMPPAPSPFSQLPAEILTSILMQTALLDLPSFVRLSLVCKKLAYLVATEETIWKRVSLGKEIGFGGMFYKWQCEITGEKVSIDTLDLDPLQIQDSADLSLANDHSESENATSDVPVEAQAALTQRMITDQLLNHTYFTYHNMLRLRPRVRFNGVYISTITYHRPGQASVDQITWNSPVHTVTYYRYLRFFRDGTCISLSTTVEPIEAVSMITRENLEKYAGGKAEDERRDRRFLVGGDSDASAVKNVMKNALKGRWHLSSLITPESNLPNPENSTGASLAQAMESAEGDCFIETEGVFPKHIYRMELSLKDGKLKGRSRRNHRLFWKGYWLYNKITGDWGEFGLRNDKSFVFSRVKSYED